MKRFAVAALAIGLPLLSVATAQADTDTVTVKGVAWKDLNGDGIRQPDEPLLPGVTLLGSGPIAYTDATGHYSVKMPASRLSRFQASQYSIEDGAFVLTRPHQGDPATDSDFDWATEAIEPQQPPVDGVLDNVDVGYKPSTADPSLVSLTPDQAPGTAHVGDLISYTFKTAVTDTPAMFGVAVQLPDGVIIDGPQTLNTSQTKVNGGVNINFLSGAQMPGDTREVRLSLRVIKPVSGTITATVINYGGRDVNPDNNSASAPLELAGATTTEPTITTPEASPVAQTTNTAELANTGVDSTWPLIAGLVLLAGGVGTVLLARRRRAN